MAASRKDIEISLGADSFKLRPLTVSQVREIEEHLKGNVSGTTGAKDASEIIAIGLRRDHPDTDIAEAEATIQELSAAMIAILQLGGFLQPGEVQAAAGSASTGATSTGGSVRRSASPRPK